MTNKERAKEIRKELKEKGITSKQVSVRSGSAGYSSTLDITIKDLTVKKDMVEEIANKHKSIRRCEVSGEILSGGNTYVDVRLDWEVVKKASEEFIPLAESLLNKKNEVSPGSNITVAENVRYIVLYSPHWFNGNHESLTLYQRPENLETEECYCLDRIISYYAGNKHHIAEALVIFKYQYDFELEV